MRTEDHDPSVELHAGATNSSSLAHDEL